MSDDIPAFPQASPTNWAQRQQGMTLRDYFAGQALQGLIAANRGYQDYECAREAYIAADAMIKERNKHD